MKNLHYLKKFVVMVISAMMVLSTFAMPTFAAETTTLKVEGVDKNSTVKAYQIVQQDANNKWEMLSDYGELKDVVDPSDATKTVKAWVVKGTYNETDKTGVIYAYAEKDDKKGTKSFESAPSADALAAVAAIAQGKNEDFTFDWNGTEKAFTEAVKIDEGETEYNHKPGSYLVLAAATNDVATVYNPMLVSINPEGTGVASPDNGNIVSSTQVVAKKSDIPFEKVVERNDALDRVNGGANAENGSVTGDEAKVNADGDTTTGTTGLDGNRGDTAAEDGVVTYRINTLIPNYADNYFMAEEDGTYKEKYSKKVNGADFYNPKFKVYDTLSKGLDLNGDSIAVYEFKKATTDPDVAATATPLAADNGKDGADKVVYYTITPTLDTTNEDDEKVDTFVVSFTPAGIKEYRGKNIEIRYNATVNDEHGFNYDGEKNTAYPQFTRKPGQDGDGQDCKGEEKKTYHYTFTINGKVNGNESSENREVIKIGLDQYDKFVWKETVTKNDPKWKPLEGVVFKLYKAEVNGDKWTQTGNAVRTATTDANGILRDIDRIDAGKYVLIEESLGNNTEYAKNTTPIKLEIQATLDDYGRLTNYKVFVDGIKVGDYTKSYTKDTEDVKEEGLAENGQIVSEVMDAGGVIDETKVAHSVTYGETTWNDTDAEAADIINTKVGTLPSTGGMGTVLFTVGGIAIMALALFLLFGAKKKEEQK